MAAPTPWTTWSTQPDSRGVITHTLALKGIGDNNLYMLETDPATGGLPITLVFDKDWGVVGAGTLRVAAELGNEIGLADFGAGATTSQTLRVSLSSDTPVILGYDENYGVVGATTLRTAAQIGNATGAANFGAGNSSAQTLRAVIATDQSALPITVASLPLPAGAATSANQTSEIGLLTTIDASATAINGKTPSLGQAVMAASVPVAIASDQSTLPISQGSSWNTNVTNLPTTVAVNDGVSNASTLRVSANLNYNGTPALLDFGVSTNALRTAALLGNASGLVTYGTGADSTQTLRTTLSTRAETATTPLAVRPGDGTNFGLSSALTAAQQTLSTGNALPSNKDIILGWDGTAHRELLVDSSGRLVTTGTQGKSVAAILYNDYGTTPVTTSAYVQLTASLAAAVTEIQIFDGSGCVLLFATGAAASEVELFRITPGGNGRIPVAIAAGVRLSVKALTTSTTSDATVGQLIANCFG